MKRTVKEITNEMLEYWFVETYYPHLLSQYIKSTK